MSNNTYWEGKGIAQDKLDFLEAKMPSMGFTGNGYMDALIGISSLYYDRYNNGGGNILDGCYKEHIRKVVKLLHELNITKFVNDAEYAEDVVTQVVNTVYTHDYEYRVLYVIWNDSTKEYCYVDAFSFDTPAGCTLMTFGDALERDTHRAARCAGYTKVDFSAIKSSAEMSPKITPAATLPGWQWVQYSDGSGRLESKNNKVRYGLDYIGYDITSYLGFVEYNDSGSGWALFQDCFDAFKAFAEAKIAERIGDKNGTT